MQIVNPEIDTFLARARKWRDEMERLRSIALRCGLDEEVKWRKPCYTYNNSNVAITKPLTEQCVLMFLKAALLKDPDGLLERPGNNA